jgi:hypothetical protein
MRKSHHLSPLASLISGIRSFKGKYNGENKTAQAAAKVWAKLKGLDIMGQKNALQGYTFEVENYVSYNDNGYAGNVYSPCSMMTTDDVMIAPKTNELTKIQKQQVENYLSTFRAITIPHNSSFELIADIIPYGQGVVMRLAFGPNGKIKYCSPKRNIIEASKTYGIDINQYSSQIETHKPANKLTYVIVDDRKILYLIKGFDAPENWGNTGVNRDIAAIKGGTM